MHGLILKNKTKAQCGLGVDMNSTLFLGGGGGRSVRHHQELSSDEGRVGRSNILRKGGQGRRGNKGNVYIVSSQVASVPSSSATDD